MTDDEIDPNHPAAGHGLPERDAVGYLIYAWDAEAGQDDRSRADYLGLADAILDLQRTKYRNVT